MITTGWKTDAESLLRVIDPKYDGALYILDGRDPIALARAGATAGGQNWLAESFVLGFTSPLLDLELREELKDRCRWSGRGFACIVDGCRIEEHFRALGLPREDARRNVLGVALHEYAHHVAHGAPLPEERADKILASAPTVRDLIFKTPIGGGLKSAPPQPWHKHDFEFGRAAIHCWYRANEQRPALELHPGDVWAPSLDYRLSFVGDYVELLGAEPQQRADEPLIQVLRSPMPEAYRLFGEQDLARATAALGAPA